MSFPHILVAGLSPAWQQILSFSQVKWGEVNRAVQAHWCASGKVLNVARACQALGAPTAVVTVLGGYSGLAIVQELQSLPLEFAWAETDAPTRVCTTVLDSSTSSTTEFVENAPPMSAEALQIFQSHFQNLARRASLVVFTGSLPRGTPCTLVHDLLNPLSIPVILDLRGPELQACLPLHPFLVKPNWEELMSTFPASNSESDSVHKLLQSGAQHAVISRGANGLLLAGDFPPVQMTPPRIATVNPIGCGDCLAAGIAVATTEGANLESAVRLGMGAAAQNASQLLPARIDRSTSQRLANEVHPTTIDH